ncbi:MAG: phosphoesterase [Pirellulaceae bacterium]|nr:MAG: phosphoesterase [Pirellulaceae bacterium]
MARLALIGGVYSNYLALEQALLDARRRSVDAIYCLGDLGAFGPHPDRVFPLLWDYQVLCIQGNYDDSIARGLDNCQCGYTDPRDNYFAQISYDYTLSRTSPQFRQWMGRLPKQLRLECEGWRVLLCHGSPRRVNEFLWESTTSTAFLEWLAETYSTDLIAVTHTGIKWKRRLKGDRWFVNVGVVGRPENDGQPHVWYTLLDLEPKRADIRFIPITYDFRRLAAEMQQEKLPEEFVETIVTGWWTTCLEILPQKERRRGKW